MFKVQFFSSFSRLGIARTVFGSALGPMKTLKFLSSFSCLGIARTVFDSALGSMKTLTSVKLLKIIRFSNNWDVKIAASHSSALSDGTSFARTGCRNFAFSGPHSSGAAAGGVAVRIGVRCGHRPPAAQGYAHFTSAKSMRCGRRGFEGKMRSATSNEPERVER